MVGREDFPVAGLVHLFLDEIAGLRAPASRWRFHCRHFFTRFIRHTCKKTESKSSDVETKNAAFEPEKKKEKKKFGTWSTRPAKWERKKRQAKKLRLTDVQLRSSYFFAHTRRHCSTMAHFPINGRLGGMGAMGWLGGMDAMGDWAEWVQWAEWVNAITQTQLHVPSSFKDFQHVEKSKSTFFFVCSRPMCHKKVLSSFHNRNQPVTSENRKVLFCATLVAPDGKKHFPTFSTYWKALNEELTCTSVWVIASVESAHYTHSTQSPITPTPPSQPITPIPPSRPLHPFRPVAHLWGSGPWCCSGVAYGRKSNLSATELFFPCRFFPAAAINIHRCPEYYSTQRACTWFYCQTETAVPLLLCYITRELDAPEEFFQKKAPRKKNFFPHFSPRRTFAESTSNKDEISVVLFVCEIGEEWRKEENWR